VSSTAVFGQGQKTTRYRGVVVSNAGVLPRFFLFYVRHRMSNILSFYDKIITMREKPDRDQIYHVFNRGVEKRIIFTNDNDRRRFISCLYFFNDLNPTDNICRLFDIGCRTNDKRKKLVEILAFVLMDNHFHLLVKPLIKDGLSEFMKKLGIGYTKYFNIKYQRVGPLFQGKYKFVLMETDEQLSYIPHYIHLNPVEIIEKKWKDKDIANSQKVFDFAKSYRWSSLSDYLGDNQFKNIINKNILFDQICDHEEYKKDVLDWLTSIDSSLVVDEMSDLMLE
jgi:putative transposase